MKSELLFYPMLAHVLWTAFLYALLTLFRAPAVWKVGGRAHGSNDGSNRWENLEPKVSANLSNQFEWPVLFYAICILLMLSERDISVSYLFFGWTFVAGRVIHSGVQILTDNVRLRGVMFTINFVAVLVMWLLYATNL